MNGVTKCGMEVVAASQRMQIEKFGVLEQPGRAGLMRKASWVHPKGGVCVGSLYRRLERLTRRQSQSARLDLGGFWMLALSEFFFHPAWVCTRWMEGGNVLPLAFCSLTTYPPFPGPRTQTINRLYFDRYKFSGHFSTLSKLILTELLFKTCILQVTFRPSVKCILRL